MNMIMANGNSNIRRRKETVNGIHSCYDLNVPLSSSSFSSRQEQQNLASTCQARLKQLGYHGIAFCHTAFNGRLKAEKDDADIALPWKILLPSSSPSTAFKSKSPPSSSSSMVAKAEDDDGNMKNKLITSPNKQFSSLGRTNSLTGLKIYRRLNIIVEEVSDVSRILLNHAAIGDERNGKSSNYKEIQTLLQKYDIISLQPMNESVLQSICELLASSAAASSETTTTSSNNTHFIDIIVLEYATGTRGGHGLPYRLRREYLENALRAGVTFELCYGTAMLDIKRRQGFLRALIDFQSAYNGIQKKHMIMNNLQLLKRAKKRGRMNRSLSKYKIPLLLSSGSRQNYTLGTADEGTMALRSPNDVNCLILHMAGVGEVEVDFDFDAGDSDGCTDISRRNKKREHDGREKGAISAAERTLTRAHGRALGMVMIDASGLAASVQIKSSLARNQLLFQHDQQNQGRGKSNVEIFDDNEDDEGNEDEDEEDNRGFSSVIDWLSAPLRRKRKSTGAMKDKEDERQLALLLPVHDEECTSPIALAAHSPPPENNSLEGENDPEDGFMAI